MSATIVLRSNLSSRARRYDAKCTKGLIHCMPGWEPLREREKERKRETEGASEPKFDSEGGRRASER